MSSPRMAAALAWLAAGVALAAAPGAATGERPPVDGTGDAGAPTSASAATEVTAPPARLRPKFIVLDGGAAAGDGGTRRAAQPGPSGFLRRLAGASPHGPDRVRPGLPDGGAAGHKRAREKGKQAAARAMHALDVVRQEEAKAQRRLARVREAVMRGDSAAALAELQRADRASKRAASTAEEAAEAEVLETSDYVWRGLLSLALLVAVFVVQFLVGALVRRLVARLLRKAWTELSSAVRWTYRFVMLFAGLGLLFVAAWFAASEVWGLHVTGERVLLVLEHPLFAFEGRPVTFLSMVFFLLTIAFIVLVSRSVREMLERRLMPRFSSDVGMQQAFAAILHYVLIFVGLLISLEVLGVGASTVAIVAGVVGIGVGFGMQHIINNFLSGLVLFFERPIKVGDVVDVGGGAAGSTEGKVVRIQARATTLVTRDGVTVIVPNSDFVQGKVLNLSIPDEHMRVRVKVGVAYDSDVERVKAELLASVGAHPRVLKEPAPRVRITDFADSAINMECLFWIDDIMGRDQIQSDIRFDVLARFRRAGIEIPFPQRDTNLRASPELLRALGRAARRDATDDAAP